MSVGKDMEKVGLSYVAGENVKWPVTLYKFGSFFES